MATRTSSPGYARRIKAALQFAAEQLDELRRNPQNVSKGNTPERQVLNNVCQMLMNCNEFLYVD
ncbi:MAG: hypothetical protein U0892_21200 [Pirellulales bacterium]